MFLIFAANVLPIYYTCICKHVLFLNHRGWTQGSVRVPVYATARGRRPNSLLYNPIKSVNQKCVILNSSDVNHG
jgi:hypothetical protein